jgi:hypothetical protein
MRGWFGFSPYSAALSRPRRIPRRRESGNSGSPAPGRGEYRISTGSAAISSKRKRLSRSYSIQVGASSGVSGRSMFELSISGARRASSSRIAFASPISSTCSFRVRSAAFVPLSPARSAASREASRRRARARGRSRHPRDFGRSRTRALRLKGATRTRKPEASRNPGQTQWASKKPIQRGGASASRTSGTWRATPLGRAGFGMATMGWTTGFVPATLTLGSWALPSYSRC